MRATQRTGTEPWQEARVDHCMDAAILPERQLVVHVYPGAGFATVHGSRDR